MSALIEAFRAAGRAVAAVFTRLAEVFTGARRAAGALFARLSAALPVGVESRAASARRRRLDRALRVLQRRAARRARRAARRAAADHGRGCTCACQVTVGGGCGPCPVCGR